MYLNPLHRHFHIFCKAPSLDSECTHLAANSSFSVVKPIIMHWIRGGRCFRLFRKCWNKGKWGAAVSKPAISVWHLFCLTVRQYQTHNIQYFAVRDSFSLYRITVLFRPNKQWGGFLWKLSICSFLVMTSHLQLMRIFISFFYFIHTRLRLRSVLVWVALLFLSASEREQERGGGERVCERHFPIGSGINWTFSWTANTD